MVTTDPVPTGNTYDKYASTNPLEQRMMRGFFGALDTMLAAVPSPSRILEVGVGEGIVTQRVIERYPEASVLGLDLPDDDLAGDWAERGLSCVFGDATTLPFPNDTFDLVLAIEVFEHLPDPQGALHELARVCAGTLIASVPFEPIWRVGNMVRGRYLRQLGNTPGHLQHWSKKSFLHMLAPYFDTVSVLTPFPWVMALCRKKDR